MSYFGHYPSIELQALAFVERALSKNSEDQSIDTEWNGFAVQLGYLQDLEIAGRQLSSALVIAEIAIPPKYQCEKWLSRYCQFCRLLINDAPLILSADLDWVEEIVSAHQPPFEILGTRTWLWE